MNQYLEMFLEESREHLQNMEQCLLDLERDPSNLEQVNEMFRSAHTLKGMALTLGYDQLASLTHHMEDLMDAVRNQRIEIDETIIDLLFEALNQMPPLLEDIAAGGNGQADFSALLQQFSDILNQPGDIVSLAHSDERKIEVGVCSEQNMLRDVGALPVQLPPSAELVMHEALQQGRQIYFFQVNFRPETTMKGARAFMVIHELEKERAEIIHTIPEPQEIEEGEFQESIGLWIVTDSLQKETVEALEKITDVVSVQVQPVEEEQLNGRGRGEQKPSQGGGTASSPGENSKKGPSAGASLGRKPAQMAKAAPQKSQVLRVDIRRIDRMMNLMSELAMERSRLKLLSEHLHHAELSNAVEQLERISGELQDTVFLLRMVPVEFLFNRFPKLVRDLAKELNKNVALEMERTTTELDRMVMDEVSDLMVHLIRNSVDHGIESPEVRVQKGKAEKGTIKLSAYQSGDAVIIEIADDGAGINREKVVSRAIEKGLISASSAEEMTDQEKDQLIFMSGLSTAEKVSDISGRGVGLDAVKSTIESLGGSVQVQSSPGEGSTFLLQLPLTVSIIKALMVRLEKECYAIPISSVIETRRLHEEEVQYTYHRPMMIYFEQIVPLVNLHQLLGVSDCELAPYCVMVQRGLQVAALMIDAPLGEEEIVVKPLGAYLDQTKGISGATILGDGSVSLILDVNNLF